MRGKTNPEFVREVYTNRRDTYARGLGKSTKAARDTNDCTVRALASATNIDYDVAHELMEVYAGRKLRKGAHIPFGRKDFDLALAMASGAVAKNVTEAYKVKRYGYNYWYGKSEPVMRTMTVGKFLKHVIETGVKDTYMIQVRGHVFTVKEGRVFGNPEDAKKMKKPIANIWRFKKASQKELGKAV